MNKVLLPDNLVIYVDDDPDDRELVRDAFYKHVNKVEMLCFGSGSEALSYLAETKADRMPCLIILDINMPILGGKEILVRLRQMDKFQTVPVVLFSTSTMPDDKQFAECNGAGIITKPLSMHQMEAVILLFIDHCQLEIQKALRK